MMMTDLAFISETRPPWLLMTQREITRRDVPDGILLVEADAALIKRMKMFKPYECVRVSETYFRKEVAGKVGAILGFSKDRKSGTPIYAVMLDDLGECLSIEHHYLSSEGYIRKEEEFYDGTFVKVKVDPKTGEGYLDE